MRATLLQRALASLHLRSETRDDDPSSGPPILLFPEVAEPCCRGSPAPSQPPGTCFSLTRRLTGYLGGCSSTTEQVFGDFYWGSPFLLRRKVLHRGSSDAKPASPLTVLEACGCARTWSVAAEHPFPFFDSHCALAITRVLSSLNNTGWSLLSRQAQGASGHDAASLSRSRQVAEPFSSPVREMISTGRYTGLRHVHDSSIQPAVPDWTPSPSSCIRPCQPRKASLWALVPFAQPSPVYQQQMP